MAIVLTKEDLLIWEKGIVGFAAYESTSQYTIKRVLDTLGISYPEKTPLEGMAEGASYSVGAFAFIKAINVMHNGMIEKAAKEVSGTLLFDKFEDCLSEQYDVEVMRTYLNGVKRKRINPFRSKEAFQIYIDTLESLLKFKELGTQGNTADFIVILLDKYNKQKEKNIEGEIEVSMFDVKKYFCHLVENIGTITPDIEKKYQQIIKLKNNLKEEDFSDYYQSYKAIRTLYDNEEDINQYDLITKKFKINMNQVIKNEGGTDKIIGTNNRLAIDILKKKSIELLEIESINLVQEIGVLNIYLSMTKKNENVNNFIRDVETFLSLINKAPIESLYDGQLNELWSSVQLNNELEEKMQNKYTSKKKKV